MACTGTALSEFSNTDSTAELTYFQWEIVQSLCLGRKWPWSILKYCSSICLNVLKKIRKVLLGCFSLWIMFDQTSWMESNSAVVNAIASCIAYELWNCHEQTHFVHFKWFTKFHSFVVLNSVNAHRCVYKFCQCMSMCIWVCQCTYMCSWVLLLHIHILMGC